MLSIDVLTCYIQATASGAADKLLMNSTRPCRWQQVDKQGIVVFTLHMAFRQQCIFAFVHKSAGITDSSLVAGSVDTCLKSNRNWAARTSVGRQQRNTTFGEWTIDKWHAERLEGQVIRCALWEGRGRLARFSKAGSHKHMTRATAH